MTRISLTSIIIIIIIIIIDSSTNPSGFNGSPPSLELPQQGEKSLYLLSQSGCKDDLEFLYWGTLFPLHEILGTDTWKRQSPR